MHNLYQSMNHIVLNNKQRCDAKSTNSLSSELLNDISKLRFLGMMITHAFHHMILGTPNSQC